MPHKTMICVDCLMKLQVSRGLSQARRHGWQFWVGGARCKRCVENRMELGLPTIDTLEDAHGREDQSPAEETQ